MPGPYSAFGEFDANVASHGVGDYGQEPWANSARYPPPHDASGRVTVRACGKEPKIDDVAGTRETRPPLQRLEALKLANEVRQQRAEIKRRSTRAG